MKKIISLLLTICILTSCFAFPSAAELVFSDVSESDWYAEAVCKIKELGYMNGTSDTTFSPYNAISRAMAVQVLYNLSGEEIGCSDTFVDVPENAWFANAVSWAYDRGIANGTSSEYFAPDALVTREQLACFIERYINIYKAELTPSEGSYDDMNRVSDWAKEAVEDMASLGIMPPRVYNFFYPEATISRAEFAVCILSLTGESEFPQDTSVHVQLIYTKTASAVLEEGQDVSVEGVLYPENSTDTLITYSSSDPFVATVDASGKVTAKAQGNAIITITCRDGGFKAYSTITVKSQPLDPSASDSSDLIYNTSVDNSGMKPIYTLNGEILDPTKPMVALTYDDGPHRTYTNRILDTLEKYNAVATFFELGNRAVNCADILQREVELGCEVANHSYSHPNLATLSAGGVYNQINSTNEIIYNACGVWPELVRPPYGSHNSTVRNNIGAPVILWSIDTLDWKYRDASYVTSVIKSNVTDGSIILMHSLYESTARATEIIVPWLLSQGYQLVTVSQLAEARGIDMQDAKVYSSFYK